MNERGVLAVIGASGHAKSVADVALSAGWSSLAFFDDAWPALSHIGPWRVEGPTAAMLADPARYAAAVIGVGRNATRLALHRSIAPHLGIVTLVHPAATVSARAELGAGTVVMAGAVVNAFSRAGLSCIVNTAATVDHDCELADGVHLSPGAHLGGGVQVGESSWIGIGAVVRQSLRIGSNVVVGAGAAVVADVSDGLTVVGVPARPAG